ncbi:glycosyltransferase family 39 protein [Desulfoprunum benzoelyticum]|uniref:Dolichol-phosphate mannosyltransferase n=1 Tax=Desulfoprunum benzoelyticum TaxID=1506996 RepID=A0A840UST0_9BACT|nr:glycosyltransferase family 39 protein [Desulfoprunum benzoelyticum]MBB5348852.1 dolichol-phosphate mannosyltransferase [Desulfoprunum benzoelyticum]MBM9530092.1 glycosyltransferase family 39 protein [Desulfoprunum benzoelyticum]
MTIVSIIVPTLNEAGNIDPLLDRIFKVRDAEAIDLEVVFVDDQSTDGTADEIMAWQADYPVRLVRREFDDGLAGAVMAGARAAESEFVVVMDADLSHPPEAIPELVAPLLAGSHDMTIGSRYVEGGAIPGWSLSRKVSSKLATLPARLFTDVRDPMAGLFAVRRQRLAGLCRRVSGFKIGFELLATAEVDLRVAEVPITFHDRHQGTSKMNAAVIGDYLRQLLQLTGGRLLPAPGDGLWLAFGTLLGIATDYTLIHTFLRQGMPFGSAHVLGGLGAAAAVFVALIAQPLWRVLTTCRLTVATVAGFWWVALLVVLLRGGIGGVLQRYGGWDGPGLTVAAVLIGAVAGWFGNMIFIFPREKRRINLELHWRCLGLTVVAFLFLLRLIYAGQLELLEEEAYYWNYARHLDIGYLDHPPMIAVLIRLGTTLFGDSEFGVRAGALCTWPVGAWFAYRYACRSFDRSIAFRTLFLYSLLPFFFWTGLVMTPDAPLAACWAAAVYFLHRALIGGDNTAWRWVGLWLGLGMLSKYTIVLLGPATVLFMLLDHRARAWFRRPQPYLAALLALLVFSPVVLWNLRHDWASFAFQSQGRVDAVAVFSTDALIGAIVLLITPLGLVALGHFLLHGRSVLGRFLDADGRAAAREYRFILCMVLLPLAVFLFFSLFREVKLNWTGPLWFAFLPAMALTMRDLGRRVAADRFVGAMRRLWPATALIVMLSTLAGLHYFSLGLPGVPGFRGPFMMGWRQLAVEVDRIVERVEGKTGATPLVVGMDPYPIASALTFYRRDAGSHGAGRHGDVAAGGDTLAWHVFGWKGLMYGFWFPPAALEGRDMLLVAKDREPMRNAYFQRYVTKVHNVRQIPVDKNGAPLTIYYYRLVRGYHHRPDPY